MIPKDVKFTDVPDDVLLEIGKYLLADKYGTYPAYIKARISTAGEGYHIICGLEEESYKDYGCDDLNDDDFKARCCEEDMVAIIETGDSPKFDRRIQCGCDWLPFEVQFTVMEWLRPYMIITDDEYHVIDMATRESEEI